MHEINLLPDDYLAKVRSKTRKVFVISMAMVLVAFLILLAATAIGRYHKLKTEMVYYDTIYSEHFLPLLKKEEELLKKEKDISDKYNVYLELKQQKTSMSEILLQLAKLTPESVRLVYIDIRDDKSIVVIGQAPSDTVIAQFMVNLGKAGNFTDVNLDHITTESEQGKGNLFTFQLTFFLK